MGMVDVSGKFNTLRSATAKGYIRLSKHTLDLIRQGRIPKGDVISTSKVAALLGAKHVPDLLPFCHRINVESVDVDISVDDGGIYVEVTVSGVGKTGYEMEALTSVASALLNVYDMCKSLDNSMVIEDISLVTKRGGKSDYFGDLATENIFLVDHDENIKGFDFLHNYKNVKVISRDNFEAYAKERGIFIGFIDNLPEDFIEAPIRGLETVVSSYMFERLGVKGILSPIIGFTGNGIGIVLLSRDKNYVKAVFENILPLIVKVLKDGL